MAILEKDAVIGNHRVVQAGELPHLGGTFLQLVHGPTGARHVHIACPDDNNAFAVSFPTVPQDSTGVAHILEHIVLAGSERFPVRDPFFAMIPRSLSTFMNAMTGADATYYPFSTRNDKDFYNLLEVYLDACFFPKMDYPSFRQEGWRYEFAEMDNPGSALRYGGVVFNEMKAANATPSRGMYKALGRALFPDLTYAHDSGGDPRHIPDLSWEALRAFHARHYHPSNSYFYTYGSLPLEETLARIEALVLSRFERLEVDTAVPPQPRFRAPVRHEAVYPLAPSDSPARKSQVLLSWLTTGVENQVEVLGLQVLQRVLLANAASPLRKALLESRIGEALADGTGLNDSFREVSFSAGLKGVNPEDAERIEALILDTLRGLAEGGVEASMIDAAIHRMELENREVSNQGFPYALKVMFQMAVPYLNGLDPYAALQFDAALARLEAARAEGPFFEGLIRRHFLDNPHRATIVLRPDQGLTERLEADERAGLARVREGLSEAQVRQIVAESAALQARQEAPEDTSVLPTLELSDIPMTLEDVPHQLKTPAGATVGLFPQPTNGISYLDLQFDVAALPDRLKDLLPLFAFVVTKMGGGASDYLGMAARIEAHTGGVGAGVGLRSLPDDPARFRQTFSLSGKALHRNHGAFFEILRDLLTALRWDGAHLKNLLGQLKAGYEARVVQGAVQFVWHLAESQFGGRASLQERWEGLSQLQTLRRLAALDESGFTELLEDLDAVRQFLFRRQALQVCVTAEEGQLAGLEAMLAGLLVDLPQHDAPPGGAPLPGPAVAPQARTAAVPVAFNAKVFQTVPYAHPDAPALLVLAHLLSAEYLHKEIREKGGAYGGRSVVRAESGTFAFLSWRDPNVARTFGVYGGVEGFLAGEITPEKIREAILGAAGDVDPLLSPDNKGRARFFGDLAGYTLERRMQFKRRMLSVSLDDLRRAAAQYLSGGAALAVISSEEKVRQANAEMGGVFSVAPV